MIRPRRLAIVGGGPRAAYALESLARRAARGAPVPEVIHVYEPRAVLGTGPAYEADQPEWVRLNIPLQTVDAGAVLEGERVIRSPLIADLTTWAGGAAGRASGGAAEEDPYPPRAQAGVYLADVARSSIRALRPARVEHRRAWVDAVLRTDSAFRVVHTRGIDEYDAVLLATGHARQWRGRLPHTRGGRACLPALPLQGLMSYAEERRPTRACLRGSSLTAIDAALALTEGLGGTFEQSRGATPPTYRPGDPDLHLTMASRTGRLMEVKTESSVLLRYGTAGAVADVLASRGDIGGAETDVAELIVAAGARILHRANELWARAPMAEHERQVEEALRLLALAEPGLRPPDARERLATSLRRARGTIAPDPVWALGQAWRALYPALVRRQHLLRGQQLAAPLAWPDYPRLRPELERLAFGPPALNAEKLIALMDAGRLEVIAAASDELDALALSADLMVDAVSSPAGVREIQDPLWRQLLSDGLVTAAPYGRGIMVDPAGGCLDPAGALVPGLSAVGRMTEDVVLGNDTLSRAMHAEMELWAQRLCGAEELVR